ncbi:hypothetical protein DB345_02365 [Spartobacteria bacterium LR76]|nr:hypothetical protein DB345_02365 [Spartobacteria bacterium LR76]
MVLWLGVMAMGAGAAEWYEERVAEFERQLEDMKHEVARYDVKIPRLPDFRREGDLERVQAVMLTCMKPYRCKVYAPMVARFVGRDLTADDYYGWIVQSCLEVLYGREIAPDEMAKYRRRFMQEYTGKEGEFGNREVLAVCVYQYATILVPPLGEARTPAEAAVWERMRRITDSEALEVMSMYWGEFGQKKAGQIRDAAAAIVKRAGPATVAPEANGKGSAADSEGDWTGFAAERGRKNPPGAQSTPQAGGKPTASPGASPAAGKASAAEAKAAAQARVEKTLVEMNARLEAARARVEDMPIQPLPQAAMRKILEGKDSGKLVGYYQDRTYRDDFFRGEGAGDFARMTAEQAYFEQANLAMIGAVYDVDEVRGSVQPLRNRYIREFTGSDRTLTEAELFAVIERQIDMGVDQIGADAGKKDAGEKLPGLDTPKLYEIFMETDAAVARARSELDPAKVKPLSTDAFYREPSEEDFIFAEGLFLRSEDRNEFAMVNGAKKMLKSKDPVGMQVRACNRVFLEMYVGEAADATELISQKRRYFSTYYGGEGVWSDLKLFALIQMQFERADALWRALPPQTRDKFKLSSKLNLIAAPVPERVQKLEAKLDSVEVALASLQPSPLKVPENLSDRDLLLVRTAVAAYLNKDYRGRIQYPLLEASQGPGFDDALYFTVSNLTIIRVLCGLPTTVSYREARRRYAEQYLGNQLTTLDDVEVFVMIRKQLDSIHERVRNGTATSAEVAIFQTL